MRFTGYLPLGGQDRGLPVGAGTFHARWRQLSNFWNSTDINAFSGPAGARQVEESRVWDGRSVHTTFDTVLSTNGRLFTLKTDFS